MQTGFPVFHTEKRQDHFPIDISAGHGDAMLTCFSIQSATETANDNIKKALLGYFTINEKQVDTGITEDVKN